MIETRDMIWLRFLIPLLTVGLPLLTAGEDSESENSMSELGTWEKSGYIAEDLAEILSVPEGFPEQRRSRILLMSESAYRENRNEPIWVTDDRKVGSFGEFYHVLNQHALSRKDLVLPASEKELPSGVKLSGLIPLRDLFVTLHLAEICLLLRDGPQDLNHQWEHWLKCDLPGTGNEKEQTQRLRQLFAETIQSGEKPVSERLAEAFTPVNWVYRRIHQHYLTMQPPPELADIEFPSGTINEGTPFPDAKKFAAYLKGLDFLSEDDFGLVETSYTEPMKDAVKKLQKEKGLTADGILGPRTVASLKGGASESKLQKTITNLNRARLLPNDPGKKFLLANLPSGEIYGYEGEDCKVRMRIVFGTDLEGQRTPLFRDEMEKVIFRPYWMLPNKISKEEYLPKIRRDMSYMRRNGYEIVTYNGIIQDSTRANLKLVEEGELYLRQQGGSTNALGNVKFLFPNAHLIYFHDTPYKSLFYGSYRAHSHGCVRLQRPDLMAEWILQDFEEWDLGRIRNSMARGERKEVFLKESVPVYIVYFTMYPDPEKESGVTTYQDYYDRD